MVEDVLRLVFLTLVIISLNGVETDLLVVLLEGGEVLPGLGELSLLHALSHVPVDKGPLGVHQVKLVIKSGPGLGDGGGVGEHADSSLHLGQVRSGHNSRRLQPITSQYSGHVMHSDQSETSIQVT